MSGNLKLPPEVENTADALMTYEILSVFDKFLHSFASLAPKQNPFGAKELEVTSQKP
jgi:hypothetical protein